MSRFFYGLLSKFAPTELYNASGSQYASGVFTNVLKENCMNSSMNRRGNCWKMQRDRVQFIESGVIARQRFPTWRQAKNETIAWLLWHNRTRLNSTLAYVSPVRFEQTLLAPQPRQAYS